MIAQIGESLRFQAAYLAAGVGATGLTVTATVYSPAGTALITGDAGTEVGDGLYSYVLAGASVTTVGEYTAVFKTVSAAVDQQWLYAVFSVGRAGLANLDASIASRASQSSVDALPAAPPAASIAAEVLAQMNLAPPGVDVKLMNGATVLGDGSVGDKWRGV